MPRPAAPARYLSRARGITYDLGMSLIRKYTWPGAIDNLEAKQRVAARVAAMLKDGDVFGAGSGSTSYVTILALGERAKRDGLRCMAIPTSHEMMLACVAAGIP